MTRVLENWSGEKLIADREERKQLFQATYHSSPIMIPRCNYELTFGSCLHFQQISSIDSGMPIAPTPSEGDV
jgi:hypothetical protein